ncbi:MAG: TonB-dependent receptor [Muribaculaceae bacterium]|nr:TonB-dependent receptor [Muribaculaceae bacterium]
MKYRLLIAALLWIYGTSAAICAEPADSAFSLESTVGEVTVTAIKQKADLTLHPLASTVINRRQVERLNIATVKGASEIAPNFYIPDYGSRMTSSIYVRGIGARIDQPVVGLNVDNVPFLNKDNYDFDLPDIARMEIIRGPQSTLYGRNTMGGLINIYTISPLNYQGSRVMAETGKGDLLRMAVSHYQLLKPGLGMSLSGDFHYFGGLFTNEYLGYKADREKGGSLRWKTDWKPTSRLSVENSAWFTLSRTSGYPYAYEESGEINYNDTCFYRRNSFADGLTIRYAGNGWSLSGITSVQYIDDNMTLDQDFLPLDYFTLTQKRHEWALTQDVIARGRVGEHYRWLGGAFGFYKHTSMDAPVTFRHHGIERLIEEKRNDINPDYPIEWDERSFVLGSNFRMPTWGVALYHESELKAGRWNFALGMRLDYERVGLTYRSSANTGYTVYNATDPDNPTVFSHEKIDIDDTGRLHKSFIEFLPKATVSYTLPMHSQSKVYLSAGKGYKSGGFNTQMFSDVLQQRIMGMMGLGMKYDIDDIVGYAPEKSWNYEAGAHIVCADGKVLTDLALFYIDCRNQQVTTFPDGTTTGRITTNAGKSRSYGAEVQISYAPDSHWLLNASYGYTHATFTRFNNGISDLSGKFVPYAPRNTLYAGLTYTLPLPRFVDSIEFNANVRGVGKIFWDEENTRTQPFYALAGGSVTVRYKWAALELWGKNLTGTKYNVFSFKSIGNSFYQKGRPITWGVTLRMNFGQAN